MKYDAVFNSCIDELRETTKNAADIRIQEVGSPNRNIQFCLLNDAFSNSEVI
jgi:hypothetical protein